jgi:hypothetical protein
LASVGDFGAVCDVVVQSEAMGGVEAPGSDARWTDSERAAGRHGCVAA